ncbi:hypothetical protein SAMD00023353_5000700 [Rosellinia necatrix]|uniref:Uncharacterized protein n=1 Tax=Rosellinia necatrix TaxID=77044 RepID=A0A1S8A9R6_ROSNE|nr:hypothetical protein SAMD00023353_5000700 [Rosellinia necatrix]
MITSDRKGPDVAGSALYAEPGFSEALRLTVGDGDGSTENHHHRHPAARAWPFSGSAESHSGMSRVHVSW